MPFELLSWDRKVRRHFQDHPGLIGTEPVFLLPPKLLLRFEFQDLGVGGRDASMLNWMSRVQVPVLVWGVPNALKKPVLFCYFDSLTLFALAWPDVQL